MVDSHTLFRRRHTVFHREQYFRYDVHTDGSPERRDGIGNQSSLFAVDHQTDMESFYRSYKDQTVVDHIHADTYDSRFRSAYFVDTQAFP